MNKKALVLNPTENFLMNIKTDFNALEGFYISDEIRNKSEKIIFAGRNSYTKQLNKFKKNWCLILDAEDINFRFLSGLHAHIVTFMSIGNIGDTILLLSENAGGHYSTESILKRIGYNVIETVIDKKNYCIDSEKTLYLTKKNKPQFAFIDRSEGLYYEDFSWIKDAKIPYCVFDGSQYLTQILTKIYPSPFDYGFDLLLSSTHKNYPGPQKAFLATKKCDSFWEKIKFGSATYISNSHPKEMFEIAETINYYEKIKKYSEIMLSVSDAFEKYLDYYNFPVVNKDPNKIHTQHIWSLYSNKDKCYKVFNNLEKLGLYTNYRLLPYDLGYGLRIGVGAAIQQGLRLKHIDSLASIFARCYKNGYSTSLQLETDNLIEDILGNGKFI